VSARLARCRACGQAIEFRLTAAGRWCPYDAGTDVSHFRTCPEARRFSRRAPPAPDDTCHRCGSTRVARLPGTATHDAAIRCLDCGQHRWLRKPAEPGRPAAE
jgi:DNA-directed RNA polymerase subunit RPC12/RpoP